MTKAYWMCQVLGWLGYSAIGMAINLLNGAAPGPLMASHAVFVTASIGMTHLFRRQIRKRWPERPLPQIWALLAGGVAAISVCQAALIIGTNLLSGGRWSPVAVIALWWGMAVATTGWTILYIRLVERRLSAQREDHLQLALREAQLHALEFQMSPHFLFNCLNSIRALVAIDPERAQDMLTRLANVLRSRLQQGRQHTVPLGAEAEVTADYLALECVRFADRLRQQMQIDPRAAACTVPPLLLQTLVENAVKHGVSRHSGPCDIDIRAAVKEGRLELEVENTGYLCAEDRPGGTRVGLANVRERLHLLYGDEATLRLAELAGQARVRATVLLPAGH